jgi:hypothetical protein
VARDLHAVSPNRLWATDITETAIPAGRVCLSPMIDCYDGMLAGWTIGTGANALPADTMLEQACTTLKPGENPTIHSDRGCHCRWPEWIRICREHGPARSMSVKSRGTGQRRGRGLLRPLETGVLPQTRLHRSDDRRVHGITRRLSHLVPGREDQNPIRHGHHR